MGVVCKFRCNSVKEMAWSNDGKKQYTIEMTPVYSSEEGTENKKYWTATPQGKLELTCTEAKPDIEVGKEYYIRIDAANR